MHKNKEGTSQESYNLRINYCPKTCLPIFFTANKITKGTNYQIVM
jgi:hypothetical protein